MAGETCSKSEYAQRRGVSAAAVSQWISGGKLTGPALVGEGRSARIVIAEADRQLGQRMDLGQSLGNGAKRAASMVNGGELPLTAPAAEEDEWALRHRKAKAEKAEHDAAKARREEKERRGVYGRAEEFRRQLGQALSSAIEETESWLLNVLALRLAAEFQLDGRDVKDLVRREWRSYREAQAQTAGTARDQVPQYEDEEEAPEDA